MRRCWNKRCCCTNFQIEHHRRDGWLYLRRLTCLVCKITWWAGLRDDDTQVTSTEEPKGKADDDV